MARMFKDAMTTHDELRKTLGQYWPETLETMFPPLIARLVLSCLAVAGCLVVLVVAGVDRSASEWLGIWVLIGVACVQHFSYRAKIEAAWERFRKADPVAHAVAQKKYWGLP
jgi:hypothetical protein